VRKGRTRIPDVVVENAIAHRHLQKEDPLARKAIRVRDTNTP
jgi:hypothetical protein